MAGTYGIHALGKPMFDDDKSRLYILDVDANLYEPTRRPWRCRRCWPPARA